MPDGLSGLLDLPLEILHQIHFTAQNPSLSLVCHGLRQALLPPCTTSTYTATYLLYLYRSLGAGVILTKALRHPICSVKVAKDIKRIWDIRRGYVEPVPVVQVGTDAENKGKRKQDVNEGDIGPEDEDEAEEVETTPEPTRPGLTVSELPRRLFRTLRTNDPIPELLMYLFETYSPDPNSHNGYPLSRAVLSKNVEVINYLLAKGADPGVRDGLAIEIAVKLGNIGLVRLLVEHQHQSRTNTNTGVMEISSKWVEAAVKSGSDAIVSYFVHEKGVMPPLHSIMQLGSVLSPQKRKREDEVRKRKHRRIDPTTQSSSRKTKPTKKASAKTKR